MFEHLACHHAIVVTGPHRSGTTIAAEMIAHDTGKRCIHEEAFDYRNIIEAERIIARGGVIQGPYLLPWAPVLKAHIVYMQRDEGDIEASVRRLRERGISTPFFSAEQAWKLWAHMEMSQHDYGPLIPSAGVIFYANLKQHPLWVPAEERRGWHHRQTS